MFRHVVMFRWAPDAAAEDADRALEELRRLPDRIPDVRTFSVGIDAGLAADNYDCAVVAEFDDSAAYDRYAEHPAHLELLAEHMRPVIGARVAVQHELD